MTEREAIEIFNKWMDCKDAYQADPSCDGNCYSCEYYASAEEEKEAMQMAVSALEKQEVNRWRPCNEKPEYDFRNVLVRWHDKRKGCEKDYYVFEGYVVRGIWCGLFEDADISDFEPIEWKPLEPYTEEES